jgi:ribosomal protein S18 acetylase RimI-like enzyme
VTVTPEPEGGPEQIDRHAAARAVESNFVETWWAVAAAWDAELHDSEGLRWLSFTPPNDDPRATSVLRVDVAEDQADAAIDDLLARFRQRGQRSVWWTWRGSRPGDIGRRLVARGMEAWPAWPGMAMELTYLPPPPVHDDFAVEVCRSSEQYADILCVLEPLGMRGIYAGAFERIGANDGWGSDQPFEHYLGRAADGRPVACATLCTGGDAAGVYAVAVAEDARRRGYGRAISLAALQAGADRGHRFGVLQSSTPGFSVYRGIGLTLVCRLQAYESTGA